MEQARVPFILPVERGVRAPGSRRAIEVSRRRGTRTESLVILAETPSHQAEYAIARATTEATRDFARSQSSATSICLRAIQIIDRVLKRENERSLPEHWIQAAATVLLLRDDQVFAARAGSGVVAIRHRGRLTSIADFDAPPPEFPLGGDEPFEPALGAHEILPTDGLVALAGPVPPLSAVEWLALFDLPSGAAAERLRVAGGSKASFTVCVLMPEQAAEPEIDPQREAELARLADQRPIRRLARTPGPTEPMEPLEPPDRWSHRRAGTRPSSRYGRSTAASAYAGRTYRDRRAQRSSRPNAIAEGLLAAFSLVPRPDPRAIFGALKELVPSDPPGNQTGGAAVAVATLDRQPWATSPSLRLPELGDAIRLPAMVIGLFLAMVVMGAIAWYVPPMLAPTDTSVDRTLDAADSTRLKALVLTDRDQTRRELNGVMKVVQDALAKNPDNVRAQQLLVMVESDLNRLDAIYRLPDPKPLISANALPAGGQGVAQIERLENDLYVIDQTAARGYRAALGPTGATLSGITPLPVPVSRQESTGDTKPVGIQTLIWMTAGAARPNAGTLAIDADRSLWEIDEAGQLQRLVLRGASEWQSYRTALGYGGNLYVLDPKANQVWRYAATQDGYNSEPKAMLEAARIEDAVDFAIDGAIYVLGSSGKVWKFQNGVGRELTLQGIDRPLAEPSAIFTDTETRQVWIADTGNKRIVVLDKEGNYVRQIAVDAPVTDVVVNEARQRLYYVADGQVIASSLP